MIINNKTKKITRESWKEYFTYYICNNFLRHKREGEYMPFFFLPVERDKSKDVIVLPLKIAYRMFRSLWIDLEKYAELLKFYNSRKK